MIYTESRYRNLCLRKKNSKLFTVDLKTLETIEKFFGKPASSEGIKTKIQQRGDMNNTKLNELLENIFTNRRDVWE